MPFRVTSPHAVANGKRPSSPVSVYPKLPPIQSGAATPRTTTAPQTPATDVPFVSSEPQLNPDLPTKDALFVFANFTSYMKVPQKEEIPVTEESLRHAQILLDYARVRTNCPVIVVDGTYSSNTHTLQNLNQDSANNANILFIKYRFPQVTMDDSARRVPTFSSLSEQVIKIDYNSDGRFEPPPAQALFHYISVNLFPPPRYIVYSYVGTALTSTHVGDVASFCEHAIPPMVVLSPAETRIRETQTLDLALKHAINMPLYVSPEIAATQELGSSSSAPMVPQLSSWHLPRTSVDSGNSYLREKELALFQNGIISSSMTCIRASWNSPEGEGMVKWASHSGYEEMVDAMELGDFKTSEMGRTERQALGRAMSEESSLIRRHSGGEVAPLLIGMRSGIPDWRSLAMTHVDGNPELVDMHL